MLNPIPELIPDEIFHKLERFNFLNERAVRDYEIRKRFTELKETMSIQDTIDTIRNSYPYLSHDTIKKIAYTLSDYEKICA
ncbi:hypothetical protein IT568_07185 [bacterium]|nr:hypothetical protein [bacterium]